jgi:hypothetical protein
MKQKYTSRTYVLEQIYRCYVVLRVQEISGSNLGPNTGYPD